MPNIKSSLRKKFINKRKLQNIKEISFNFSKLFKFIQFKFGNQKIIIGGYYPSNHEVNVINFLQQASKKKYIVTLPVIEENKLMNFKIWNFPDILKLNKFGIPEPILFKKMLVPDLILVPLIAFDKDCNRLGYGAGFYDRYLQKVSKFKKNFICVGVAYNIQKYNTIPISKFDYRLDNIFTETGFFNSFN